MNIKKYLYLMVIICVFFMGGCAVDSVVPVEEDDEIFDQLLKERVYKPIQGDIMLYWAMDRDIKTVDPGHAIDFNSLSVINNIYEGLLRDTGGKLELAVAESYVVSDGGKVYTFYLDKGSRWSDGTPVTAYDFEYAWERNFKLGEKRDISTLFSDSHYEGCKAVSGNVFRVWLSEATPYFPKLLVEAPFMPMRRPNNGEKNIVDVDGGLSRVDYKKIVSNGPFVVSSYIKDTEIILAKNYRYKEFRKTKIDKLCISIIEDSYISLTAFRAKEIMVNSNVPKAWVTTTLKDDETLHVYNRPGISYLDLNHESGKILNDKNIREALSLIVDRYEICDLIQNGHKPILDIIPESITTDKGISYSKFRTARENGMVVDEKDIERANKLMNEAGYGGDKIKLKYLTSHGEKNILLAQSVKKSFEKYLGIELNITSVDWQTYNDMKVLGDYDIARSGWICDYNDPYAILNTFSERYHNNTVLSYIKKSAVADGQGRDMLLLAAEDVIHDNNFVIPIYNYVGYYQKYEQVENIKQSSMGYLYFGEVELSLE